jgi:hypothetical protein
MSVKDSLFVHYLNKHLTRPLIFSIQEKCTMIIDSSFVSEKFNQLNRARKDAFIFYLKEKKVDKQINISGGKNVIPYDGFSFYKIEYKGEFPESLIKAYEQMNDLNNEAPRKKFKQDRRNNGARL